jgi:hypothetical protein
VLLFVFSVVQPCLSLLCIPDKPGVKILPFYLKEENYSARLHQIKQVSLLSFSVYFFGGPLLCLCRPFCNFWRCLDSNPKSCRSKQRYQLSNPSPYLATHLPIVSKQIPWLKRYRIIKKHQGIIKKHQAHFQQRLSTYDCYRYLLTNVVDPDSLIRIRIRLRIQVYDGKKSKEKNMLIFFLFIINC